jgi:hypothetical protein
LPIGFSRNMYPLFFVNIDDVLTDRKSAFENEFHLNHELS